VGHQLLPPLTRVQLLVKAAEAGLQTTSFRIGQISGGHANGAWATTDWLPIMVKSSISLGCLPATEGVRACRVCAHSR
jgi:thioester reductase-like protein